MNFLLQSDPITRVILISVVLISLLKIVVYCNWKGHLSKTRFCIYFFLWFGMDPGTFSKSRRTLSWKRDVWLGLMMMFIGTLLAWMVWIYEFSEIHLVFIPMSLGFHFGALRALKGLHRSAGFPVRTLFPNLLRTTGVADFWRLRWNVNYSQMMQRLVGRRFGFFSVFVVSGLLHEVAITLPVGAGWGWPSFYFLSHGILAVAERQFHFEFGKVATLFFCHSAAGLALSFHISGSSVDQNFRNI